MAVSQDGLCRACNIEFARQLRRCLDDKQRLGRRLQCMTTLHLKLETVNMLAAEFQALIRFERAGVRILDRPLFVVLGNLEELKRTLIVETLRANFEKAKLKAEVAATPKAKVGLFAKVLLSIREHIGSLPDPKPLQELEREVTTHQQWVELDGMLQLGREQECTGQPKKALATYRKALYFLQNDQIEDSLQSEHLAWVQERIAALA